MKLFARVTPSIWNFSPCEIPGIPGGGSTGCRLRLGSVKTTARVCTVEFEIVILRPEQDILEFERSRCFIAGRYYQICVISVLIQVQ